MAVDIWADFVPVPLNQGMRCLQGDGWGCFWTGLGFLGTAFEGAGVAAPAVRAATAAKSFNASVRLAEQARAYATAVHRALHPIAQKNRVVAVLIARMPDGSLVRIVGSGARDLAPGFQNVVGALGNIPACSGTHMRR